jgi:uncharacterized protein YkwD
MRSLLIVVIFHFFNQEDTPLQKSSREEVYLEINQYRKENGLPELKVSKSLERSAKVYAFKLHAFYSDNLRHKKDWFIQNKRSYELLAYGHDPVNGWKKSYAHNRILLSKRFTHMGLGLNNAGGYVLRISCKNVKK